jgi:uncharacterized membrane protein
MDAKAKILGHSVHQMLIVFPLGLLGTSVVFDLLYLGLDNPAFAEVAYWMQLAGVAGALIAAPFGFIDWLGIPRGTRARRVGAIHGGGNLVVAVLFLASVWMRSDQLAPPPDAAYVCSFLGVALSLVTAWLGGELVDRLGVGVHEGAHVDAPSSLKVRHVPEQRLS